MLLLTDSGAKAYALDASSVLTRLLSDLAQRYNGDAGAALRALAAFVQAQQQPADDPINAAMTAAATSAPAVQKLLNEAPWKYLLQLKGNPAQLEPRTLADLTDTLDYPVSKAASAQPIEAGDTTLTFGAKAQASASVGVLTQASSLVARQLAVPASDALLRFQLAANFGAQGAATLPFEGGSASASGNVGAGVILDALYQWPATRTVADALVYAVGNLVAPWNLADVDAHLARADAGAIRGLRRLEQKATGSMVFAGSLAVGRTWAYDGQGFAAGMGELNANLSANLSLDVSWKRQGTFDFSVQRDADGSVVVEVTRDRGEADTFGLNLGADLSIKGTAQVVQPIVDRLLPDDANLMADLQKWSAPGQELADALIAKLGAQNPFWGQLASYLLGVTSNTALVDELQPLLTAAIQHSANRLIPFWGQINNPALVQQLAKDALTELGLQSDVIEPLIQPLIAPLQNAVTQLQADLQAKLAQLVLEGKAALAAKLAPLNAIGENVQALVAKVDDAATTLLVPVIKLLSRYESARKQVMDAVAAANDIKVGLALRVSRSRTLEQQSDLVVRFRAPGAARAQLIYRALMLGRLDTVGALWSDAIAAHEVDAPSGTFTTTISRERALDLSVYFGDHIVDWSQTGTSAVKVSVDASGMVAIGSQARFGDESVAKAGGTTDAANFRGTIDVATALATPGSTLPLTFAFGLTYADTNMKLADLKNYVTSLISRSQPVALLDQAAVEQAFARLDETIGNAQLATALTLDPKQVGGLVASAVSHKDDVLRFARAALIAAGATGVKQTAGVLLAIASPRTALGAADLVVDVLARHINDPDWLVQQLANRTGEQMTVTGSNSLPNRILRDVKSIDGNARGLLAALQALASIPHRLTQARIAAGTSYSTLSDKYAKALSSVDKAVLKGLKNWFIPPPWIDVAPPGPVALLSAMAQIANAAPPVLTLLLQIDGTPPQQIAF